MKKLLPSLLIALAFVACNSSAKKKSETGIELPPNVVEKVQERYNSTEKSGLPKKAVYIDTTSKAIVAERHFYATGKMYIEHNFKNGLKNGVSMAFRDTSGTPWSLHTYYNDTLNGPYKTWHPNGNLMMEGQYKMGAKDGSWRFFDEAGNVIKIINFVDSIPH